MCGIAGFWAPGGLDRDSPEVLRRMTNAIRHRGPDGEGHWLDPEAGIALGHRRLSILDLSDAGSQPMCSGSGRYVATYNGEIYNWRELRREEEGHGARFRSHSDTEVFLALCDRVGIAEAVSRSIGMFAMGVWDRELRELTLVRDRLGEKPLYFGWAGNTLLFGSELKALRAHTAFDSTIDRGALKLFLRHNYIPAPHSIFKEYCKLSPGTLVSFRADGPRWPDASRYWSISDVARTGQANPIELTQSGLVNNLDAVLGNVVADQMVADVSLGAFLSGGIDSSLIVGVMQRQSSSRVRTFTIGFREAQYDEASHARAVADHLGTIHTELYVSPREGMDVIPVLSRVYDEPFADVSQIPTMLLARLARGQVTVALSGDGGDEAFGGYLRYEMFKRALRFNGAVPRWLRRHGVRAIDAVPDRLLDLLSPFTPRPRSGRMSANRIRAAAGWVLGDTAGEVYRGLVSLDRNPDSLVIGDGNDSTFLPTEFPDADQFGAIGAAMLADAQTYLPDDILVKVDRATMAASLECRAPLLDRRLQEFAWRIAPASRQPEKGLLRQLLYKYVPATLVDRRKQGFGVPIGEWLRGDQRDLMREYLSPNVIRQQGLFDSKQVNALVDAHLQGAADVGPRLWGLLMATMWQSEQ